MWYGYDGTDYEIYFWNGSSTTKITNNSVLDISPQINNLGEVVWEQYDGNDYEIYYWNGVTVTQITNNTFNDYAPRISDSGQIVWYGDDGTDYEIYIANMDSATTTSVVPTDHHDISAANDNDYLSAADHHDDISVANDNLSIEHFYSSIYKYICATYDEHGNTNNNHRSAAPDDQFNS